MRSRLHVQLIVRYGDHGNEIRSVALAVPESLGSEVVGGVELSDDPMSLLLASPGLAGGFGGALTIRKERFQMRREVAEQIAAAMVPELLKAFGVNDQRDGYPQEGARNHERQ